MQTPPRRVNRTFVNLLIDVAILIVFLIATAPQLTGLALHEWLSIAFGAAIVTHLLLHWQWIVGITRNFFTKSNWNSRLNYILNALLFISMTIVIFTGLLISEVALPLIGITLAHSHGMGQLHRLASDATVLIVGLHTAVHWRWIVNAFKRLGSRFLPERRLERAERNV